MVKFTPERIAKGLEWRLEALMERMPQSARVWMENRKLDKRVRQGQTTYDRSRLMHTYRESLRVLREKAPGAPIGDYLEFGVYHGTSISCMHAVRKEQGLEKNMRLIGFDSFEGLPDSAAWEDDSVWAPGMYASSMDFTRGNLQRWGVPPDDVTLVKGWFQDSLTSATRRQYDIRHASIFMVDCDLYSSTQSVLNFSIPLVNGHAVFVFDDWDSSDLAAKNMGEARAFEEWLTEHPEFSAEEMLGLNYKDKAGPRVFLVSKS